MKRPRGPDGEVSRETPTGSSTIVSRETIERLRCFEAILAQWSSRINLISRSDQTRIWSRHIEDSLQLVPLVPHAVERAIDFGSGGGLPGIVLAIATGISFDLIEADHRKAAFLREAARATGAPVNVHAVRIEDAVVAPAPLITARALAPLTQLLNLTAGFIAPGGAALFLKGEAASQELTEAQATWNMRIQRYPSRTHPAGVILKLSEVERA